MEARFRTKAFFGCPKAGIGVRESKEANPAPFTGFAPGSVAWRRHCGSFFSNRECTVMARVSWMQRLYWRYLSKPAAFRDLYLHAIDHPVGSILEIGMGSGQRIQAILGLCQLPPEVKHLRYAAVDPFESAGTGGHHLSLKAAHRMLSERGVKAHLIPGDVVSGVMRVAHTVLPSDLVLIEGLWNNGSPEAETIAQWLPRLCHSRSVIFASSTFGGKLEKLATPAAASGQSGVAKAA